MAWHPVVIPVVQAPGNSRDGGCKGTSTNAARYETGGAGAPGMKVVQLGEAPKSSSGESCQMDW